MKILLYSGHRLSHTREELDQLFDALVQNGFHCYVNNEFAKVISEIMGREIPSEYIYHSAADIPQDAEMMICYGGDGTFLGGVGMLETLPIPVVGINSGRLGFLANISKEDMVHAFSEIRNKNYRIEQRTLLEVSGPFEQSDYYPYAFNEFSVQRQGGSMISIEAYADSEMIATYWGDGVLVSTPTGSTAYSLSVGGPIVVPECNCLVISPISPHNLTMRPLVVPDTSTITLKVQSREHKFLATLDNRSYSVSTGATFSIKKAEKPVFLVQFQNISFYDTLRKKMMWGMDRREVAE